MFLNHFNLMSAQINEKIIYLKLRQKDKEAFIKAYDNYIDDIYRFIYFKVGKKEDAEDITSLVFLKSWDYIQNNKLEDYKTLKAFFYKVARNAVIDHYRKNSGLENISIDKEEGSIDIVDEKIDLEKAFDIKLDYEKLMSAMASLKGEYREVLMLRYINELSIKEIADILEKDKGNVRVLLFRAIGAIKKIVSN
ncbi:MAG: RNA polymerase, sigma-24 subunit, ECF subfamily [Candidatus Falkowbacteria bacterium GW2011_GWC2_38_22]|nr:MAG: RNA polymerase, sigma-24 subunit, ECF subfamily [Candidatus Falkowbacteria bacterium GW2011_GWF2_38_1205]KKQ60619.1 MAG: RNA polymerase, sigma-24 subunit, ECF subfamily [Candidatus Falkowbacteria bacterium GW2011_GWC2_38_22]KKQ62710.1 MAG: RNA polymerase, sigma-24 subunit, ECF subfamily [Candidatus Falkowbacteria bacterium GW2011_GWF1_38_22]KKQ64837.1 MAG: RNA polymerase, sigma-24 subunit, ECF subfamily [Candidatus Falkowbacteria bacterium GW2011_GWE2_38_254]KKQ72079.1 MAG: RNA polymera